MRLVLAIVLGIVAGLVAESAVELLSNWLYPVSLGNMWDRAQLAAAMAARPTNALLLGVAAYFLGGLVGGVVGKLISRRDTAAWVPAGVLGAMALAIAFGFPVPTWTMFATFVAPLIGGLIANHLIASAPGRVVETED